LAEDFDLPVQFVQGSFIPTEDKTCPESESGFAWLATSRDDAWDQLGLAPADFGVTFAYPWPDEESFVESLFARHANPGSLLLTYHEGGQLRLRRKRDLPAR
jgi:hypothetical protein